MNETEKTQIIRWAEKGMSVWQLWQRFRPITITEIREICNSHYNKNKHEFVTTGSQNIKKSSDKRNRKTKI